MKRIIKFLLGNAFLKTLLLEYSNKLFDTVILWIIVKIKTKFHGNPKLAQSFEVIANEILSLQVEDFLKDNDEHLNKILKV